jgi:DNA-binding transcriptional LysR family regulator
MELRHLRYFLAVAEALNFTKAAALLRVAQPALSRRVQDLEDEIGVDLLKRSPRGVTLTAEGKLFLEKTRHILKLADEAVEQVRALARGEEGELHMGYAPAPTVEILPPALAAFQKAFPRVRVLLHDFSEQELIDGLRNGKLELALMPRGAGPQSVGLEFETLRTYPICVAVAPTHRFARLKTITLEMVAAEAMIGFNRKDYPEYYVGLDRMFAPLGLKPRFVVECDSSSSLITEIETGRGVAIASPILRHASGKRLLYRPLSGTTEVMSVGIARATKGDVTPAGEKFCEILRRTSKGATLAKEGGRGRFKP